MVGMRKNSPMRQLQLFTAAELAGMRDRTASRNYSAERDEFRREHERHRAWGLIQRRGQRLRHLRNSSCAPGPAVMPEDRPQDLPPAPAAAPAAPRALRPAPAQVPAQVPAQIPAQGRVPAPQQRRCTAWNQVARNRHIPARRQLAPAPRRRPPRVEPAPAGQPLPAYAAHDLTPGESPPAITPNSNRPMPRPPTSHRSGRKR